ncbi:MAG: hypothetical protein KH326_01850 [Ruminococcus callidus]|uniref:hypothetical protein n=1 Tax=Ruminococcus callidus TaxID=40519 RepID=UPI0023F56255|nr:hypothetical protein [Ruminococcus callidus]MBS6595795.1 hypothetical protein [Ruminococcus callidus]
MPRSSIDITTDINTIKQNMQTYQKRMDDCTNRLKELEDKLNELRTEKEILEQTYQVIFDLRNNLVGSDGNSGYMGSLQESCICIQEIRSDITMQIYERCNSALQTAKSVHERIELKIKKNEGEYESYSYQMDQFQDRYNKYNYSLNALNTELSQVESAEDSIVVQIK